MIHFAIKQPTAFIARQIENNRIRGKNSTNTFVKVGCKFSARLISITVFPLFLFLELTFKRIPKLVLTCSIFHADKEKAAKKWNKRLDKVEKFTLGLLFCPLGLRSPDGVSGLFLKAPLCPNEIRPFGVEKQFGKEVETIRYPQTIEELRSIVQMAKDNNTTISIIGAGMSQGTQTIPGNKNGIVISMKNFNSIEFDGNSAIVGAGATWEEIQYKADREGKSVIVKQASDIFSIGGSIGINCHGWAHEVGAIASTVESLTVINAEGEVVELTPKDELFGCMFGTLGYFGIIVSAKLKLENNQMLEQTTDEVSVDDFATHYKDNIKNNDYPLCGGRLVLDNLNGNPLRSACVVKYARKEQDLSAIENMQSFNMEPTYGLRIERIALQILSHLSYFTTRRLVSYFWSKERESMLNGQILTRNEALHPPINAFKMLHHSNLHAQWLQEYFISEENLPAFLKYLGETLKDEKVRLVNATIRPTPKDEISVLPYAEKDRYAVVICFRQYKTNKEIEKTKTWITKVNKRVVSNGDRFYQAYMPYASQEEFIKCYGEDTVNNLRRLKTQYDPLNIFSNAHTQKYYDAKQAQ